MQVHISVTAEDVANLISRQLRCDPSAIKWAIPLADCETDHGRQIATVIVDKAPRARRQRTADSASAGTTYRRGRKVKAEQPTTQDAA